MKTNEVILHGECMIFAANKIPADCKKVNKSAKAPKGYIIVAASETLGNHHVVDVPKGGGVQFFEDDKGTLFMENSEETQIRCLHADRHDAITIPPGTYEFGTQQEYDPFAARLQNVRD